MRRGLTKLEALVIAALLTAALSWGQAQEGGGRAAAEAPTKLGEPAPPRQLGGPWMLRATPENRLFYLFTFSKDGPEMTQWGLDKFKQAKASNTGAYSLDTTNDPVLTRCAPPGTPRVYFHPYPFEFIETPKFDLMIFEYDHTIRRIYTDGRPVPEDPDLTWMGTSVGHWESDHVFVVDTVGLNDRTWIDRAGHPHSDKLHVTERFNRVDKDHLQIEITMTDPIAFVKPWKSAIFNAELRPKWELGEISCSGDYLDFSKFEK
jgi:hypothetical protein